MKLSPIEKLPSAAKEQVEAAILREHFSNYERLAEQLSGFGKGMTKSSLHRHGQKMKLFRERARFEAEVMANLGDDAAYLLQWSRREPRAASRLVKKLRAEDQKRQQVPTRGGR